MGVAVVCRPFLVYSFIAIALWKEVEVVKSEDVKDVDGVWLI